MALHTEIARLRDGLLLVASVENPRNIDTNTYKDQAKKIFRCLTPESPQRLTVETTENLVFHYAVDNGVIYICLCERGYPKKLAFSYLEDIQKSFSSMYGSQVESTTRPYAFVKFNNEMKRKKELYSDTQNIDKIRSELQDVHDIMIKNIEEVLDMGTRIEVMDDVSGTLINEAARFGRGAKMLHQMWIRSSRVIPIAIGVTVLLLFIFYYLF
eukprot:gnl/Spiro4/3302_TR1611_c0_g1_i1.p1 gnl/Spiro4/3302_TR1611_c0_g1~~gnl/Spiro4/3302_TR1611_c0_g1_i1.p1  ORF type:complete len:230 (-),score=48.98 gnl/Spiro4/3302_TR1611_c0_g1_i1:26-664(-)